MGCVSSKQIAMSVDGKEESTSVVKKDVDVPITHDGASIELIPAQPKEIEDDPYMIEYVLKEWKAADRDNSGRLSFHEIMKLLHALNITLKEHVVKSKFLKVDKDNSGELDFNEFRNFLEDIRTRPELKALFAQYSKNSQYITVEEFVLFLKQEQYELSADAFVAQELIKQFTHSEATLRLYFTGFSDYITSNINSGYNHKHRESVYQLMDQPLPHYYIASSHNTYLEADQLKGASSVDAYITALKHGCRCVELDCWDGEDGFPIIYHGHTMTSKIKFRDVIQACKDYAFVASPYPLILSLENHCSVEQQVRMAEILVEVLGDMLTTPFIVAQTRPLPSPEALKNKILVKGKMLSQASAASQEVEKEEEEEEEDEEADDDDDDEAMTPAPKREPSKLKDSKNVKPNAPIKVSTAQELSDLVHFKSVHFGGFDRAKEKNAPWEISSFSELKIKKLAKGDMAGLIQYNMNQTCRIYPKGTRFDSSNYNPVASWNTGCQVVALNYQTGGVPMRLNMGKFWDNGGCGYVLKPASLRSNGKFDDVRKKLHIRLVSGWQLPKESGTPKGEVIDPYVKIRMYGVADDCKRYKSKVVANNGFNPQWDERFSFDVSRADLAEVVFEVYDQDKLSKDDFLGYCAIPVTSIQPGYRSVHLFNSKNQPIPEASLFVQLILE